MNPFTHVIQCWRLGRLEALRRKLLVQEERSRLLTLADRDYGTSYYRDRAIEAWCQTMNLRQKCYDLETKIEQT
jgi:hypothetical protein